MIVVQISKCRYVVAQSTSSELHWMTITRPMKRDRAIHVQKELVELDLRDYSEATKRALLQDGEELS